MIGWTVMYVNQVIHFISGRQRLIAYSDLSFIALQYEKFGFITNSIVIVSLIRALVSADFLWNEHWCALI
jgi:7-dehydrocholesterol reductase